MPHLKHEDDCSQGITTKNLHFFHSSRGGQDKREETSLGGAVLTRFCHRGPWGLRGHTRAARARVVRGTGRPGNRHMPRPGVYWKSNSGGPRPWVHMMYAYVRT